ncbi:hypothetical protein Mterra_02300 [Calidithermus terrae]|uniref:Uncharacterized protein n=1 Tax=Calidithermus terrae TaxID=1408545 RepID=A0A399EHE0_9DEIN|nr:hypothetical protein Mterra_02300 [Calidithermus terrae]
MVTTQAPSPPQAPSQPAKACPLAGVGVRLTRVPSASSSSQSGPQSIPPGSLLTAPSPLRATLSVNFRGWSVRLRAAEPSLPAGSSAKTSSWLAPSRSSTVKLKLVVPLAACRAPPLSLNSTRLTPTLSEAVPLTLRLFSARTAPSPGAVTATIGFVLSTNAAVTLRLPSIVTRQLGLPPEQAPPQALRANPASGLAVSVTLVPALNWALQVGPQPMPAGSLSTRPGPWTLRVSSCLGVKRSQPLSRASRLSKGRREGREGRGDGAAGRFGRDGFIITSCKQRRRRQYGGHGDGIAQYRGGGGRACRPPAAARYAWTAQGYTAGATGAQYPQLFPKPPDPQGPTPTPLEPGGGGAARLRAGPGSPARTGW